jgi:hypothetical protein
MAELNEQALNNPTQENLYLEPLKGLAQSMGGIAVFYSGEVTFVLSHNTEADWLIAAPTMVVGGLMVANGVKRVHSAAQNIFKK